MVTIINALTRSSKEGKTFAVLQIQGDIEMIQSATTGKFYATAKRCFIPSTFDELTAKSLIGTQIAGNIARVECDHYEYTVPSTGEIITLAHTYEYQPEVFSNKQAISSQRSLLGS